MTSKAPRYQVSQLREENSRFPKQCSLGNPLGSDVRELENDMRYICAGFSPDDLQEEFERTTHFHIDSIAASVWGDERKQQQDTQGLQAMDTFARPSEDSEIINWDMRSMNEVLKAQENLNVQTQDSMEISLRDSEETSLLESQDPTITYLEESQDYVLKQTQANSFRDCGTFPVQESRGLYLQNSNSSQTAHDVKEACFGAQFQSRQWHFDGGLSAQPPLQWESDHLTNTFTEYHSTSPDDSSLQTGTPDAFSEALTSNTHYAVNGVLTPGVNYSTDDNLSPQTPYTVDEAIAPEILYPVTTSETPDLITGAAADGVTYIASGALLWQTANDALTNETPNAAAGGFLTSEMPYATNDIPACKGAENETGISSENSDPSFPVTHLAQEDPPRSASSRTQPRYLMAKMDSGCVVLLETSPFQVDTSASPQDSHLLYTKPRITGTLPRSPEVHLLRGRSPGPSLGDPSPRQTTQVLGESPQRTRLPHQHRSSRLFLPSGEAKKQHQRDLAKVRSRDYMKKKEDNHTALRRQEQEQTEINHQLNEACRSLESMRLNYHAIYQEYREQMPPSIQKELDKYVAPDNR
ncbi:uncharacterized protein LOC135200228 [Macrobrachium nipponense]|uniref:uncharacterized protein LOC135200228 n=1 Tax=Macrobrachium nipponense TaxID=159736 RepID=UPI0030C80D6A